MSENDTRLLELEARVRRLEDMLEIQQLQSRYAYCLLTQRYERIMEECFAKAAEGIAIEFSDSGIFRGRAGIERLFKAFEATKEIPGFFTLHMTVNPYIVIAKDGLSASSTWLSPGASASNVGARWIWGPFYVDYVKETGRWRIRSSVFAPLFRNRYEFSWVEETDHGSVKGPLAALADAPPSRYRPYDRTRKNLFSDYPELPEES
ncbi:MAG: hypothetical protein A3I78_03300 [Gammaproteobacteria bacterium RIFCSPLOWO2_02_FULL_56_15]|nr:MAG: hypothetical protein A3I78_03300 [Gammaproteobacteria bacterium RIFCSPLOWO2_02_FULL_56_15]